ncbi:MAG TPA: UDP-N-acetylglucosamine 2-epimerase (non-hydrolyzing) [Gaiellaceae bacterium]
MSTSVCFVVGARPNFMKSAPVYRELAALDPSLELVLVHTGQHYDEAMSEVFFEELGLPRPDEFLGVGPGTHAEQTAKALVGVERVLREREIDLCVVAGDVNSTLAGALAAVKQGVMLAHIESGLRSFDRTMPEEHNRKLTDHLSDILFVHSDEGIVNLGREGIDSALVHLVGNTMIDSLLEHLEPARERRPWEKFGVEPGAYGLVTLHRPALVDEPDRLEAVTDGLIALAGDFPVVFPVHPRTRARLEASGGDGRLREAGVHVSPPLGYLDFLGLEADAAFVATDSGGVQEETTFLGVRCFTLRDSNERLVTEELGTNTRLGARPERLVEIPKLLERPKPGEAIPGWDGAAGSRAAKVLRRALG